LAVEAAVPVLAAAPQPLFIAAGNKALFAWHHAPPSHLRRGAGIVLCPPLGYEYMSSYATWRILAERLAASGFDALRLEYEGTGNSDGRQEDPGSAEAWLRSVERAIAELRRLSASNATALIGLRAGALIALRAAAAVGGVERLVLWSPFASGRAFVRELEAIAGLSREEHADDEADAAGVNVAGYVTSPETLQAIESWTPDTICNRPAPAVLLVHRDDRPIDQRMAARLEALGSDVTQLRPDGTSSMLEAPHLSRVADQAVSEIVSWFGRWPVSPAAGASRADAEPSRAESVVRGEYKQRAVRFGPGRRLFGVLTSPDDENAAPEAPAVVLFNTGVECQVGPHRLYVPLAREWAARGHVVLRFDIGGIGDSAPPPGAVENIAYPDHMLDDAGEAIEFVRKIAPGRPVIVAGLCSGGWLAFRSAREGLPVDGIVPINAPMYLRDAAGAQWAVDSDRLKRYMESMRAPAKWMKALRGNASYSTFVRVTANALSRDVAVRVRAAFSDAMRERLAGDLREIARRGIRSVFVFSRGDDGLAYFRLHGAPALECAEVRQMIRHVVVDGAGHTFRPRAAQHALRAILTDFVSSKHGVAAE
jgi:alpha-beta hydrolase superfamily lysophospholipase